MSLALISTIFRYFPNAVPYTDLPRAHSRWSRVKPKYLAVSLRVIYLLICFSTAENWDWLDGRLVHVTFREVNVCGFIFCGQFTEPHAIGCDEAEVSAV